MTDCEHPEATESVYRDPRTGRDHIQYVCTECGARVKKSDAGRMV